MHGIVGVRRIAGRAIARRRRVADRRCRDDDVARRHRFRRAVPGETARGISQQGFLGILDLIRSRRCASLDRLRSRLIRQAGMLRFLRPLLALLTP